MLALYFGLSLPLIGFIFIVLMGMSSKMSRKLSQTIACTATILSFICFSISAYMSYVGQSLPQEVTLYSWIPVTGIDAYCALHIDHLSLLLALIITGIGSLIHLYSCGYMEHDTDYCRYFAFLNFFVFCMLLLVFASELILLFVGWEGVGLASYLLIGFWYSRPAAAQAAKKAFIVNRIGDLGLLLGILLCLYLFGTSNIHQICSQANKHFSIDSSMMILLSFLIFCGATGKSAQLPLHVWLPDAMEGPTPVSALIHAATMVNAGVYLIVRMHPIFLLAPTTLQWIGIIGCVTSLFAALCAISQTDLKRVLAYSTISQLGLMFLACGAGAFYAAVFHLTAHACVKALLFLSAGNVSHMMQGITDMRKMGGLAKQFTITHVLFLIGVLSMAGLPPLSTFFSKDLILEDAYASGLKSLYYLGTLVTFLTAFYLTRAYMLTFRGAFRIDQREISHIQEASYNMLWPVWILAVFAAFSGFLGYSANHRSFLLNFLITDGIGQSSLEAVEGFHFSMTMMISVGAAMCGVLIAVLLYRRVQQGIGNVFIALKNSFYVDYIYDCLIIRSAKGVSYFCAQILEPIVFDGSVRIFGSSFYKIAKMLQMLQSGQIRSYFSWMVIGSSFVLFYFIFVGGSCQN